VSFRARIDESWRFDENDQDEWKENPENEFHPPEKVDFPEKCNVYVDVERQVSREDNPLDIQVGNLLLNIQGTVIL